MHLTGREGSGMEAGSHDGSHDHQSPLSTSHTSVIIPTWLSAVGAQTAAAAHPTLDSVSTPTWLSAGRCSNSSRSTSGSVELNSLKVGIVPSCDSVRCTGDEACGAY